MDFIFMLTREDRTVANCLDILDEIEGVGVGHIGFKDVGVDRATLSALVRRIEAMGAVCYMEVVSETPQDIRNSIETAAELGVKRVLGGQDADFALARLAGTGASYYPFPGHPVGHPTVLGGGPNDIEADCARFKAAGCPGVDLLAYRASEADPLDLIRAARAGLGDGYLIVAGSIDSPGRIRAVADAGADAFTVGSAIFDRTFASGGPTVAGQCRGILEACRTHPQP